MRLIDVSEYSLKGAEIHWIEHDYHTINVHRKPLYEIPTVDAAPVKHGRWIKGGYACGENEYKCSACGETEWRTGCKRMKYCMYCGAKMDLEEQDAQTEQSGK